MTDPSAACDGYRIYRSGDLLCFTVHRPDDTPEVAAADTAEPCHRIAVTDLAVGQQIYLGPLGRDLYTVEVPWQATSDAPGATAGLLLSDPTRDRLRLQVRGSAQVIVPDPVTTYIYTPERSSAAGFGVPDAVIHLPSQLPRTRRR